MLSDVDIKERIRAGELIIEPFEEERLGKGIYRLRVGGRAFKRDEVFDLEKSGFIRIGSGDYINVETYEWIVLPSNLRGHFVCSPELEMGLYVIPCSSVPGFKGRPEITLWNWHSRHVDLEFKDELCLMTFEPLEFP